MQTLTELKLYAKSKNCKIVFNKSLGAYQVKRQGFTFSESVYAFVDENNKLSFLNKDAEILKSYI